MASWIGYEPEITQEYTLLLPNGTQPETVKAEPEREAE
jgi:hypothetical protein